MKRSQHRILTILDRFVYPSDLTDTQWEMLESMIPAISPEAAYHVHEQREIVNAILYVLHSRCPWRLLPNEFPAWQTVYYYFGRWQRKGIWDQITKVLQVQMHTKQCQETEPGVVLRHFPCLSIEFIPPSN